MVKKLSKYIIRHVIMEYMYNILGLFFFCILGLGISIMYLFPYGENVKSENFLYVRVYTHTTYIKFFSFYGFAVKKKLLDRYPGLFARFNFCFFLSNVCEKKRDKPCQECSLEIWKKTDL